jgi:predicted DNA-binding helix-hairpin-helix protein
MEPLQTLSVLATAASVEATDGKRKNPNPTSHPCGLLPSQLNSRYGDYKRGISIKIDGNTIPLHMAAVPGGRRIPLLKAMINTACERDCNYCAMRAGSNLARMKLSPEEMAKTYHIAHRIGVVQGLFLSNGIIAGGASTQDRILATAEILRHRYNYRGYLHLKIMPGADRDQVLRTMQLADRVSVNLEAPDEESLRVLAPSKNFQNELVDTLRWIEQIRQTRPAREAWNGNWPSSTTQFVVGAANETDLDLLSTVQKLRDQTQLARAYFEAFDPKAGTPFEYFPPENPVREHRLYQASFLLRDYGFDLEELQFDPTGNLALDRDPKLAYAEKTLSLSPIEINAAAPEELVRVPGIGVRTASKIMASRKERKIYELGQLRRLGVIAERAAPYITLDGKSQVKQLSLF